MKHSIEKQMQLITNELIILWMNKMIKKHKKKNWQRKMDKNNIPNIKMENTMG